MGYRGMGRQSEKSGDAITFGVQLSAEFQLPASDLMQLPGAEFGDRVGPSVDSDSSNTEGSGNSGLVALKEFQNIFTVHDPMLSIAYRESKNDLPAASYAGEMETMGDRIRLLRQSKSLTQEQLGDRLGVSKVAVSQWETGSTSNIRLKTFLTL